MFSIIGIVVLMVCVFGGYIMAGGSMAPIIKAAPIETFIIGGAAVGAMLIGNSLEIFKGALGGIGRCFKGPKYKKDDYLQIIFLVSKLMKVLKAEGAVALEPHIENPESSAIFAEYPPILKDEGLLHMVTDTIRLLVVSSSNLRGRRARPRRWPPQARRSAGFDGRCPARSGYRGLRAGRGQNHGRH